MRWRIVDGPNELQKTDGVDGVVYIFLLESVAEPPERRSVRVVVTRSLLASTSERFDNDVVEAVNSQGQSAVESFLGETDPPHEVVVSTSGVRAKRRP